jgi:ribosomal subunit interface protein
MEIEVVGVKYEVGERVRRYATKRMGKLRKFLPRKVRKEARASLKIEQVNRAHGNKYELMVEVRAPGLKQFIAKDEAANVFAGVDVIEEKLAEQMRKAKKER